MFTYKINLFIGLCKKCLFHFQLSGTEGYVSITHMQVLNNGQGLNICCVTDNAPRPASSYQSVNEHREFTF